MAAMSYTNTQRAEVVIFFEDVLHSKEIRQYRDIVFQSLQQTISQFDGSMRLTYPTILRWYVTVKSDRMGSSPITPEYERLKSERSG